MAVNPQLLNSIANPKPTDWGDPAEQMGQVLNNAMLMEKIRGARSEEASNVLIDQATKRAYGANGLDREGAARNLVMDGGGRHLQKMRQGWAEEDKTVQETDHQKMLALKTRVDARGSLFKNTKAELASVSEDPKTGPLQMLKVLENTHPDLVATMGEEMATKVLNQRVHALKQAVADGKWAAHRAREILDADKAMARHVTEVNQGDKTTIVSTPTHVGGAPPKVEWSGKTGINPNTVFVQSATNVRQTKNINAQAARQDDQQSYGLAKQDDQQSYGLAKQDDQQAYGLAKQDDQQSYGLAKQEKGFTQQNSMFDKKVENAQTVKSQKDMDRRVAAGNIIAQVVGKELPRLKIDGVNPTTGEVMISMRSPEQMTPQEKRKLESIAPGLVDVVDVPGMPLVLHVNPQADLPSLRKKLAVEGLVVGADGKYTRKAEGVAARPRAGAKQPNFRKEGNDMFNFFYKDPGFIGNSQAKAAELENMIDWVEADWKHRNAGGPPPGPANFGPGKTEDMIRANNMIQEERKRQSQIDLNNSRTNNMRTR